MQWGELSYNGITLYLGRWPVAGVRRAMSRETEFYRWADLPGLKKYPGGKYLTMESAMPDVERFVKAWIGLAGLKLK